MSGDSMTWRMSAQDLKEWSQDILGQVGLHDDDASRVADHLITADLRGVHSHGVVRMPWYVSGLESGAINPCPKVRRVPGGRSVGVLDGDNGMGQVVAGSAMEWALEMACAEGVGVVAVRGSNHFGTCAYYAEMATQQNLIGIAITNGWPLMAPWGGRKPMLGNHPLAIGIPTKEEPPILFDMATSVAAQGKIALAAAKGERLPMGWALDKAGRATDDAQEALEGLLMPVGGHKGYGLSLMIGLLAGTLSGAAMSWEMRDMASLTSGLGTDVGHLMAAISVNRFILLDEFQRRVDESVRSLRACPKADGVDRVYVPGEIEYETMQLYLKEGIPLHSVVAKDLVGLAARFGVGFPSPLSVL